MLKYLFYLFVIIASVFFIACGSSTFEDVLNGKIILDEQERSILAKFFNDQNLDLKTIAVFIDEYMPMADNYISISNSHLVELRINNSDLGNMGFVSFLPKLRFLDLSDNKIKSIEGLKNLVDLENLYLSNNEISKIEGLDTLKNLKELVLTGNEITKIQNLSALANLIALHLELQENNGIAKIENLDDLEALTLLNLDKNSIKKIENLDSLKNLNILSLNSNQIKEIDGLENLTALNSVFLSNNQITKIPQWTKRLTTFDISNNPIEESQTDLVETADQQEVPLDENPSGYGFASGKSESLKLSYGSGLSGSYKLSIKSLKGSYANSIEVKISTTPSIVAVSMLVSVETSDIYIYIVDENGQWKKYLVKAGKQVNIKGYINKFTYNQYQFYIEAVNSSAKNIKIDIIFGS
jgi:Leucine-rich repeat (LRR) protein